MSKLYYLNNGLPQGSPLSSFLFGVYVAEVFRARIMTRPTFRRMVSSFLDDEAIMVATMTVEDSKEKLVECLEECRDVAERRGMGFSTSKMDWLGFGDVG